MEKSLFLVRMRVCIRGIRYGTKLWIRDCILTPTPFLAIITAAREDAIMIAVASTMVAAAAAAAIVSTTAAGITMRICIATIAIIGKATIVVAVVTGVSITNQATDAAFSAVLWEYEQMHAHGNHNETDNKITNHRLARRHRRLCPWNFDVHRNHRFARQHFWLRPLAFNMRRNHRLARRHHRLRPQNFDVRRNHCLARRHCRRLTLRQWILWVLWYL